VTVLEKNIFGSCNNQGMTTKEPVAIPDTTICNPARLEMKKNAAAELKTSG
jgi:hypothetical protein